MLVAVELLNVLVQVGVPNEHLEVKGAGDDNFVLVRIRNFSDGLLVPFQCLRRSLGVLFEELVWQIRFIEVHLDGIVLLLRLLLGHALALGSRGEVLG